VLALMGAIFGFLRFNSFPARLFMGDSGSQFLGFGAGVLAVIVTQHSDPALSPVVPVLILGLPVLDTLKVMIGRIARGRSPFEADRTHLHHRLLASGLSQYEAVSLVYGAQFLLVVLAYLLRYSSDSAILLTYGVFCTLVLFGVSELERRHGYLKSREEDKTAFARLIAGARKTRLFTQVPFIILSAAIPLFLMLGALMASPVSRDIGLLAAVLFSVLLLAVLIRPAPFFFVERLTAYTAAVAVAYLVERSEGLMDACGLCIHLLFGVLAIITAFWVRFSSPHFKVSTLDVLILLAALAAPSLRGLGLQQLSIVALESIVLFYGIEVLMQERERHWDPLRIGFLAALAILTIKGLLL
jgi:UDP-GlcNAc:undecaprenyl-phosphate GlcNAc-1-phosphate transferase